MARRRSSPRPTVVPCAGARTSNSTSRTPHGTKRPSITIPGTPKTTVRTKKSRQPMASARTPATGPERMRGSVNRLDSSANCVAEKRFCVNRNMRTPNAPAPESARAELERDRGIHERTVRPHLRDRGVAEVRGHLQDSEDPERAAEAEHVREDPPDECPDDRREHPDRPRRDADVEVVEARLDEERAREGLGEVVAQLVEHDEREDLERAVLAEEAEKRPPDRLAERARRRGKPRRLRRRGRHEHHRQVDEREQQVHDRPRPGCGEGDRHPARHEHARAIRGRAEAGRDAVLLAPQHLDGVPVEGDVLRGRGERDRERERADDPHRLRVRRHAGEAECRREERDLAEEDPPALAAEERRPVAVHRRGPQELERPRGLREREEADDLDVDARARHPRRDREPHEAERQAGREGRGGRRRAGATARSRPAGSPTSPDCDPRPRPARASRAARPRDGAGG